MKPKINVLIKENGVVKAVTREMTDAEYAEYLEMLAMAEGDEGEKWYEIGEEEYREYQKAIEDVDPNAI